MPPVVWTHRAERRLQTLLIRVDGGHHGLAGRVEDINQQLAGAFPAAHAVIVLDFYSGFRTRRGEHILLVDIRGDAECGTSIVKLADDQERLQRELSAWRSCTPICFAGNAVFMRLEARPTNETPPRLVLIYQDAQQHIGTDEIIWLETAVLRSVQFGAPDPRSVINAIADLYSQLGRVLYPAARIEAPDATGITLHPTQTPNNRHRGDEALAHSGEGRQQELAVFPPEFCDSPPNNARHRLDRALANWSNSSGPVEVRQQVSAAFPPEFGEYIDPVDYVQFLMAELDAGTPAASVLPRVLRGPAHGDMHGRNVLVGVEDNCAGSVAVYDYEHMSCDNLLAWDFVKMETELKIRALEGIVPPGRLAAFAACVEGFEARLAQLTHTCRETGVWRVDCNSSSSANAAFDRLAMIVLAIREQADLHLGTRRKRYRDWLHEYYFLLACYGVWTVTYDNQNERERTAAIVSAGVAAALYELGRPGNERGDGMSDTVQTLLAHRFPGYQELLRVVRRWNRTGSPGDENRRRAEELLSVLIDRYPTALHVWYEWAFAVRNQPTVALDRLARIDRQFHGRLDEDTYSLWGRCYKDKGHVQLDRGLAFPARSAERMLALTEADTEYKQASIQYEKGFKLSGNWFPGINLAFLTFMRAALARDRGLAEESARLLTEARRIAEELLAGSGRWFSHQPDDDIWHPATRGEASVLLGKWEEAIAHYTSAIRQRNALPRHLDSMGGQLRRIIQGYSLLDSPVLSDLAARLPELLSEPTGA